MKTKKINIFIGLAPNHILNFETMIVNGLVLGENILLNPGNLKCQEKVWDQLLTDQINLNNTDQGLFQKIRYQLIKILGYKRFVKRTKKVLSSYIFFSIYYANLEDALSNYFFFSFKNKFPKERVIVEDGALNYYYFREKDLPQTAYYLKIILANLLGFPFKRIKGDVSGIEYDYVKKQYVRAPNLAVYPKKSLQLPYQQLSYSINNRHLLIIGQEPYSNFVGKEKYEEGLRSLCAIIKSRIYTENTRVFYKPHRHGAFNNAAMVLENYFTDFLVLKREDIIEELIETIKPSYIFSFDSSALLNIKIATQGIENLKIIAYLYFSEKLLHLYHQIAIEVIRLNK